MTEQKHDESRLERVIRKIKRCLALSKSSNENEAATAIRQAQALMREYRLTELDVRLSDVDEVQSEKSRATRRPTWDRHLGAIVARVFGCRPLSYLHWCDNSERLVSFPRKLSDDLAELIAHRTRVCGGAFEIWEAICEGFAAPAQHLHAEPIAWMVGAAIWWTKEGAERDAAEVGQPVVGLGPMNAHQGEPAWFMTPGGVSAMHAKAKPMSDQQGLDTSADSVPLYIQADPGEAEQLRAQQAGTLKLITWLCNDIDSGITSTWHAKLKSHLDGLRTSSK
ncbi:DUF2786 domain-containing protein [Pseudomonas putida]|uniref:DUF2786 domain-containing protein n=1 Tax=Pseudomonas putida TaxID=303 RepID=UPI0020CE0154|nr:DUF2786 domain-containing protein [Pseudomonas putida]